LAWYRCYIYQSGVERGAGKDGEPLKPGFTRAEAEEVKAQRGELPAVDQLRRRVRYFSDGLVIGSKPFVEEVFAASRERFGSKRRSGARPIRHGGDWGELKSMRDLRAQV
jgi:hypothetical protein